jgi:hypothetical protein
MTEENGQQELDFEGQRPGEELLFVFRRHIIAMRKGFYPICALINSSADLAGQA